MMDAIGYSDIVAIVTVLVIVIICMFWEGGTKGYLRDIILFTLFCVLAAALVIIIIVGVAQ